MRDMEEVSHKKNDVPYGMMTNLGRLGTTISRTAMMVLTPQEDEGNLFILRTAAFHWVTEAEECAEPAYPRRCLHLLTG